MRRRQASPSWLARHRGQARLHAREWKALGAEAEARKWAMAKWLSDEHEAGKSIKTLAQESGRSEQVIRTWMAVHRSYAGHLLTFDQALAKSQPVRVRP